MTLSISNHPIRVGVFGSSSTSTKELYVEEAIRLGELIAKNKCICVNGAGRFGVMGGVNEGVYRSHGEVIGVIHKRFSVDFGEDPRIKRLIVVDGWDLAERKLQLFAESDCLIVMPGGVGTFDELWEGVCAKSLSMKGLGSVPMCLVNIEGFYDGFIEQMNRAKKDGVLYSEIEEYFHVENTVDGALNWCIKECQKKLNNLYLAPEKRNETTRKQERSMEDKKDNNELSCTWNNSSLTASVFLFAVGLFLGWNLRRH